MPSGQAYRKLRVFLACPGDVTDEKLRLVKVVKRLQRPAGEAGYVLELKEWRQTVGVGRPQQGLLSAQARIRPCDATARKPSQKLHQHQKARCSLDSWFPNWGSLHAPADPSSIDA